MATYMCMRVADQDEFGGTSSPETTDILACDTCGEPVYSERRSRAAAILLGGPLIHECNQCRSFV